MANEIIIREKQFINNKCGKAIKAWFKAAERVNRSSWAAAKIVYDITTFEMWKDDFETQKDLAEFLGSSQSQISKMSRAYEYYTRAYDEDESGNVTHILEGYTLAAVTAIMKIELCLLHDFIEKYNITRETPSRQIYEYVKEYKADEDGEEEAAEVVEDVEAEIVEEAEEATDDIYAALVTIEKKVNEVTASGNLTENDIERIEKAVNDLKILLV